MSQDNLSDPVYLLQRFIENRLLQTFMNESFRSHLGLRQSTTYWHLLPAWFLGLDSRPGVYEVRILNGSE